MKNKTILFILIAMFMTNTPLCSQNNLNLLMEGKQWSTLDHMPWMPTYKKTYINKFSGDTLLEGVMYKKIWQTLAPDFYNWSKVGYIRKDSSGAVYVRNNWGYEGLIYDFTVEAGDTIEMGNPFGIPFITTILQVDNIWVEPLNEYRKRVILKSADPGGNNETWIEGIGSMAGILFSGLHALSLTGSVTDLLCQWDNDVLIYQSSWDECFYTTLDVNEPSGAAPRVFIRPHPLTDKSVITIAEPGTGAMQLFIHNLLGQLVFSQQVPPNHQIVVRGNQFNPGFYQVTIHSDGKTLTSTKLIVQ